MSILVSIKELLDEKYDFFIPSYQRGYRWGEFEVEILLKDLDNFFTNNPSEYYCMQPIVVANKGDNKYEVIDGQQRLTTFYILAKVLKLKKILDIETTYSISYETRAKSKEFLEHLDTCDNASNIDFYYMKKVFEFFNNTKNKEILKNFDLNKIKVIWHEINVNQIDYFLNLNANKTPLEEVELIKAKMINALSSQDEKKELAQKWSEIESVLANDRFYYFIANNERKNRMSVLFEIIYEDKNIYKKFSENKKDFKEFYNLFEKLKELYKDEETYHKIGYLAYFEDLGVFNECDKNCEKYLNNVNNNFDTYLKGFDISYFQPTELKKVFLYYEMKYHLKANSYFRFDLFKKDSYDIEHIYPKAGEKELNDDQKKEFIKLYNKINQEHINNNNFDKMYKKLTSEEFPNQDNIYNLCLLNSSINRSYGNLPFIMKKQVIYDCIKLKKHYILEHCKLAFSNYEWNENKAKDYLKKIVEKIKNLN